MSKRTQAGNLTRMRELRTQSFKLTPLTSAIAVLISLTASQSAHAQQAFSSAWFAAKGTAQSTAANTGYLPNGMPASSLTNPVLQKQKANQQLQTSLNNLAIVARGIAAQQAAQQAARQAAMNGIGVSDGLADGGLKVDADSLTQGWLNAMMPTQSTSGGQTTVAIQQTADKAILNWESFNVGKNTILNFLQQPSWAVLNRVNDPLARPSQIQGQIKGDGTVMIVNRNGIVFSGSSQVDTRNLVAAAANISDTQFRSGIYGANGNTSSFTDAQGKLIVEAGARLSTAQPGSVTQGGGYVLLLGSEVSNAGIISTPKGQAELAAGDSFIIRKGYGTDANTASTTRGNEISPQFVAGSKAGKVVNTGLLTAPEGDVTLAGRDVQQNGVALSTTTVNTRGSIHLLNSASDVQGSVTLGQGSYTAVLINDDGASSALNSQRDAMIADSTKQDQVRAGTSIGLFDNLSTLPDRRDQSRVEIVSGGNINFIEGSLTLATGGQVSASASRRSFAANGAILDVSGAVGVSLPMSSNGLLVNVQGNELRDAPVTRDNGTLANSNVWIDTSQLIYVPAGTGGYASDRWYTAGGLLEVGGYLANQGHRIGEWAAQGGTVALGGSEVITQNGSSINLSGGSLNVQTGYLNVSWLKGSDGQLYRVNTAPANLSFSGVYKGFEDTHARWGKDANEYFYNPLIGPQRILQNGYTVGRDAGRLIVNAPTAVLEGDITATVYNGPAQSTARTAGVSDGYKLSQRTAALPGSLMVGLYGGFGLRNGYASNVRLSSIADIADAMRQGDSLSADRINTVWLDASRLSAQQLGGLTLVSTKGIVMDAPLSLADGGQLSFTAPAIAIASNLTVRGGSVSLGNIMHGILTSNRAEEWWRLSQPDGSSNLTLGANANIDLRGVWTNAPQSPDRLTGLPYIDGGWFTADATGSIEMQADSTIDVSSGGAIQSNGKAVGGKGGNVSLISNDFYHFTPSVTPASLILGGSIRAYGFNGGGTLKVQAGQEITLGQPGSASTLALSPQLLQSGFTTYDITGMSGINIASGTQLQPQVPVYRFTDTAYKLATGGDIAGAAERWLPPLFDNDPAKDQQSQRVGADLTLTTTRGDFNLAPGAAITVDPGHAVNLYAYGQTTLDGSITAHGGNILVAGANEFISPAQVLGGNGGFSLTRSIWIGGNAVLDVSGQAVTAFDNRGRSYGSVSDGGSIALGGASGTASDAFVIIRSGARLEASGAAGVLDIVNGNKLTPTLVASNGGSIVLNSNSGIYIDGDLRAAAGGAGASGGTLSMNLVSRIYDDPQAGSSSSGSIGIIPDEIRKLRNLTITQHKESGGLSDALQAGQTDTALNFGQAAISVDQVRDGGFASLALKTSDLFIFKGDVNLALQRSLTLAGGVLSVSDATPGINVVLSAPYARIDGFSEFQSGLASYHPGLNQVKGPSLRPDDSTLTVSADLIDLAGQIRIGAHGHQGSGALSIVGGTVIATPVTSDQTNISGGDIIDASGFGQVNFVSRGDVRLGSGTLKAPGDVRFSAAQLYPLSGAQSAIYAGLVLNTNNTGGIQGLDAFDPARPGNLVIRGHGGALPAQPASVFGSLSLIAANIDQGGVVRAPLGVVAFNSIFPATLMPLPATSQVVFRDASVTSASASGLTMPFGGTSDGTTYQGADGTLYDLGTALIINGGTRLVSGISVSATTVVGEGSALLDLSGGGTLLGAGFVSGRGGSVDVLKTALVNANPSNTGVSSKNGTVYAILPGYASAYAPVIASNGAGDPAIGRQVTIAAGVPGLAAGTYTLLPSSYAMLPGAFRVELGASGAPAMSTTSLPNGSILTSGQLGVANAGIHEALPTQLLLTPGATVRTYSQYNETSYVDFARSQAATFGNVRPRLPDDGKILQFVIGASDGVTPSLAFSGRALFDAVGDGIAGSLVITSSAASNILDITAPGAAAVAGHATLSSDAINAFNPASLFIGGAYAYYRDTGLGSGAQIGLTGSSTVNLLDGAALRAGQVFLIGSSIDVASGAVIDTRGLSTKGIDSRLGYAFGNNLQSSGGNALLAVANGWLNFLPAVGSGSMNIGDGASLLTEGTIAMLAPTTLNIGNANFGARYLTVSQDQISVGDSAALAAARAAGVMPAGWVLDQQALDRLLHPSASTGVPALERLTLTAGGAINFFGSVRLDARGVAGTDVEFVLNTPAIYGLGSVGDSTVVAADRLVWNGIRQGSAGTYTSGAPAAVIAGGAGTGSGSLTIQAKSITLGYDHDSRPTDGTTLERVALGFANLNLVASERIVGNSDGSLSVGQARGVTGTLLGGNLNLVTPLLSGTQGATIDYLAGGAINVSVPVTGAADTKAVADLGGTVSFTGDNVSIDTAVALPSGKLTLKAEHDVTLGANARIDLAGHTQSFFDLAQYSWGGDLIMSSAHGDIVQRAGGVIDVSASMNDAGSIVAVADDAAHGRVIFGGSLLGAGSDGYRNGHIAVRVQRFDDFAALNAQLNQGGFFGARSFSSRTGDIVIGDEVRAQGVDISADGGSVIVNGRIDASGAAPGSIRLAARDDLVLAATAVLDTHGTVLQTDSYGAAIDANNTAHVELVSSAGTVRLAPGSSIDLRAADGVARGKLEIDARRQGASDSRGNGASDIAIDAAGRVTIAGAASIALNGFWKYNDAPLDPSDSSTQVIDKAYLAGIHAISAAFIDAAGTNAGLQARLAGLKSYGSVFHLRPGIEIDSATPNGNLATQGDIDLSGYRYGPDADAVVRGSGEPGKISLRAGGNLKINGSINDGFAPPPASPDSLAVLWSGNLAAPYTVTTNGAMLNAGTMLPNLADYDPAFTIGLVLPLGANYRIRKNPTIDHPVPFDLTLASPFTLADPFGGGNTIHGYIYAPDGSVLYTPGSTVSGDITLGPGSRIGAGNYDLNINFARNIILANTTWNAGADTYLLGALALTRPLAVPVGTVLPANLSISSLTAPGDRQIWAIAPMLAGGAQSWSLRMVGGADLAAANGRALQASDALAAGSGNVVLNDPFRIGLPSVLGATAGVSVVRTGTGELEILTAGDYRQDSPFGVYTAGTAIAATGTPANDAYNIGRGRLTDGSVLGTINADYEATLNAQRMYYTERGGDLLLLAQGDISGYQKQNDSKLIGGWLWRQGGAGMGQAAAWGINFGSYVGDVTSGGPAINLAAFSGMGTLGGGRVTLNAGRDIGLAGQGVVVAVGGSGRVLADGSLVQTGGGTLSVKAGRNIGGGGNQFIDLRGNIDVSSGAFGSLTSSWFAFNGNGDPRPGDTLKPNVMQKVAGGSFAPGDGTVEVRTRGDLAMDVIDDPGRVGLAQLTDATSAAAGNGQGASWYTLWTDNTAINLAAAGGNLSPLSSQQGNNIGTSTAFLPPTLRAVASGGSIYLTPGLDGVSGMMPSRQGELQLLARGSVIQEFSSGGAFGPLSTSIASLPTPFKPAWVLRQTPDEASWATLDSNMWSNPNQMAGNNNAAAYAYDNYGYSGSHAGQGGTLFAFGANTVSDRSALGGAGSRIYAVDGDVTGINYGERYTATDFVGGGYVYTDYYRAAKTVNIMAAGDIVNIKGLILQDDPSQVSTIAAGRSVIYAGVNTRGGSNAELTLPGLMVAGPGTLEISAGKNIYQGALASVDSMGPLVTGDARPGASIIMQAGLGQGVPGQGQVDWSGFASRYLDVTSPAVKHYDQELASWLKDRYRFTDGDAVAYFTALPTAQQRVFLRQVYYAELKAGGREYNDAKGPRFGSYQRGRQAIAALFPSPSQAGGDIIMLSAKPASGSYIASGFAHTDFGGDIQLLAPAGKVVVGTDGIAPGADAGLITQGRGDIEVYSRGSLLLGLSRVMTTFGGDILAWSAEGDINAGRGSKTTVLYTSPKRVYDDMGNVTLSPQVPSNGAGIATLAPIPEVPAGDIDLIAPLGTIDAGEAGIRVSGNVNLAALQVVNAANIQVKGESTGIPMIAAVNVGALTNASAAASSAAAAAQESVQRARNEARQALPSIFTVRVLGFGNDATAPAGAPGSVRNGYDVNSPVQVLGQGAISEQQKTKLTGEEKLLLGL